MALIGLGNGLFNGLQLAVTNNRYTRQQITRVTCISGMLICSLPASPFSENAKRLKLSRSVF